MAIEFKAPPKKQPPSKFIRVTEEAHNQIVRMAEVHEISITRMAGALIDAHYKNGKVYQTRSKDRT